MAAATCTTRRQFLKVVPILGLDAGGVRRVPHLGRAGGSGTPPPDGFLRLAEERRIAEEHMASATTDAELDAAGARVAEIEDMMLGMPVASIEGVCARMTLLAEEWDRWYSPDPDDAVSPGPRLFSTLFGQSLMFIRTGLR